MFVKRTQLLHFLKVKRRPGIQTQRTTQIVSRKRHSNTPLNVRLVVMKLNSVKQIRRSSPPVLTWEDYRKISNNLPKKVKEPESKPVLNCRSLKKPGTVTNNLIIRVPVNLPIISFLVHRNFSPEIALKEVHQDLENSHTDVEPVRELDRVDFGDFLRDSSVTMLGPVHIPGILSGNRYLGGGHWLFILPFCLFFFK